MLRLKERQFIDALTASLGVTVSGLAVPASAPIDGPAESLALRPLVAGQTFGVRASFVASGPSTITLRALDLVTASGWTYKGGNPGLASRLIENRPVLQRFEVTAPAGALPTRSLLTRESPDVPRYQPGWPRASASPGPRRPCSSAPNTNSITPSSKSPDRCSAARRRCPTASRCAT